MLAIEAVRPCAECGATTPHRRERLPSRALLAGSVGVALFGWPLPLPARAAVWATLLAVIALDPGWRRRCQRCAGRERSEKVRSRPGLRSERFFL